MTAEPRWATPRTPSRPTLGDMVGKMAVVLGMPLMEWQQRVADVALEQNEDGSFAYRDITITVPRQNGKSSLLLALQMTRALAEDNQNVRYAAQHGAAARQKLIDDWLPALKKSPLSRYFRPRLTSGHEQLLFKNGSSIGLVASTEKSGHGSTVDLAIMDEAFAHPDARVEQSLRPAMLTRPRAQLWIVSTAGTMALSPYLWGKVEAGRQLVEAGVSMSSAYFEWSAEDDADPGDPATWRSCMPALGHTITEDVVAADFAAMSTSEFQRAMLNRWVVSTVDPVVPLETWYGLIDQASSALDPLALAFDVTPDRSRSAIAAAGQRPDGRSHIEVVDHRPGTGWVVQRMAELVETHRPSGVYCDASGPAGSLMAEIERLGIEVVATSGKEHAQACGIFYDAATQGTLRHLGTSELTAALDGAKKRTLGDAWAWSRKTSSVDISPLVACTLALWGANAGAGPPGIWDLNEVVARMRGEAIEAQPDPVANHTNNREVTFHRF